MPLCSIECFFVVLGLQHASTVPCHLTWLVDMNATVSCILTHALELISVIAKYHYNRTPMSKLNHRKEIKQKDELRARFQFSMSQNNAKVLNWLTPLKDSSATSQTLVNESFFDLPIIASGSGLSSLDDDGSNKVNKIGDFVNLADFSKMKADTVKQPTLKAMSALMNKMRDSSRDKVVKSNQERNKGRIHPQERQGKQGQQVKNVESDSDSDGEVSKSRSVKKGGGLSFGKAKRR